MNQTKVKISDNEVRSCTDSIQLQEWKLTVNAENATCRDKLLKLKCDFDNGIDTDPLEYRNLVKCIKKLRLLLELIQLTQGKIKRKERRNRIRTMDYILINLLKERMSASGFNEATVEAKKRYRELNK